MLKAASGIPIWVFAVISKIYLTFGREKNIIFVY